MHEVTLTGEVTAGESAKVRHALEHMVIGLEKSKFDVAELLTKVKAHAYYQNWGYNTFKEYTDTLAIKARTAQYLVKIVETFAAVGVERIQYEPLGIARLREISSLEPHGTYRNPVTNTETPMREFILGLLEKDAATGDYLSAADLKQHVRTLKGFTGSNDLVWLNLCLVRSNLENTIRPALELAKAHIGSVGKDTDGVSQDASDGAALEVLAVEFLNGEHGSLTGTESA